MTRVLSRIFAAFIEINHLREFRDKTLVTDHGDWDYPGRMQNLRWMRVPGDTLFAIGAIVLVAFVFTTRIGKPKPDGDVA